MEKNLDITNPRYNKSISPVPWHIIKSRFHCMSATQWPVLVTCGKWPVKYNSLAGSENALGAGLLQNTIGIFFFFCAKVFLCKFFYRKQSLFSKLQSNFIIFTHWAQMVTVISLWSVYATKDGGVIVTSNFGSTVLGKKIKYSKLFTVE